MWQSAIMHRQFLRKLRQNRATHAAVSANTSMIG